MTIQHEIEIPGTEEVLTVEFDGNPTWEDDSYSDERGLVEIEPYASIQTLPTWDRSLFTPAQNDAIEKYVLDIKSSEPLLDKFCAALTEEMELADY